MAQPLRIETPRKASLLTSKTLQARLWFINNRMFEQEVLAYLAKYVQKYEAVLYACVIQGNHIHLVATFPKMNRTLFMRSFNSAVQRALVRYEPLFGGGQLFGRRFSAEVLPLCEDVIDRIFYCALQAVANGLTETIEEYPAYNSFFHAISGTEKTYRLFNATAYYRAKRRNPAVPREQFYDSYTLKYERPEKYKELSNERYKALMLKELKERTAQVKAERAAEGKIGYLGRVKILQTKPGSLPLTTKKSKRNSFRPLVLTRCPITRRECLEEIFATRAAHREASKKFLAGDLTVKFPRGTYPPPGNVTMT